MATLTILGSAFAIADEDHDHTHLLLTGDGRSVLIDCSAHPIVRLRQAKIDPLSVTDLILTHFHPDHVSGFGLFILDNWLMGRRSPLNVYGLDETIYRAEAMLDLYNWQHWSGMYEVNFLRIPLVEKTPVLDSSEFSIYASYNRHMIPGIGLRIDFHFANKSLVYSSDTEPSPEIVRLATEVDILLHESAGPGKGHSSPSQAGEVARQAKARHLLLIHYNPTLAVNDQLLEQARGQYDGQVSLARDLMRMNF